MNYRITVLGKPLAVVLLVLALLRAPIPAAAQSTATIITLSANDLAYSDVTGKVYASNTNTATLTPINAADGTLGTPISITNLSGRLCAGDGGQYIFAALNGPTNHICQFDVNAQSVVNAWPLGGYYVDDLTPVLGSPASVAVARMTPNQSPRFAGVAVYDNGVARTNIYKPFLGPTVIETSRTPNRLYGYDNETSLATTYILQVDASGVSLVSSWGALQGFGVDIAWRAGWLFATTGQIFDPDRGIQVGSFSNTPVSDDAASGRYYLALVGGMIAYDQNTLLPVGVTSMPGVTGVAGSLIRCGTNGFAMRVNSTKIALMRTPLVSSGPPADLQLSLSGPPLPVPTGSAFAYTLTVSNQGPNIAQSVALTQTFPSNTYFMSVTASSGSNTVVAGTGILSQLASIPVGGAVTVTVNLLTAAPGLLASVASVTSGSIDPNLSNNVVRLEFPVGTPPARNSVTAISLQTTDLAWDKVSGRIFASIPNANWLLGNSLAALDPLTGNFDSRIPTPIEPAKLAVADNGQYLYSGINSDSSIQRVNLPSRALDIKFPTGFNNVSDMAVVPGSPQTIAATVYNYFAVYDDGVMRPNTVGPNEYNFGCYLALSDTNTIAYEALPTEFRRISIDTNGATQSYSDGLINNFDDQIKFDAGLIYTAGGRIIDPASQTTVANLPYSGLVCPDSRSGKIFYLTVSGTTGTLTSLISTNLMPAGSVGITGISGSASSLIRYGTDGLAFRTTGNQLYLIRTILADDSNNDGMADSWELANFGTLNVDPNGDPDHDGLSNYAEYLAGTDPNNPNSVLRITGVSWPATGLVLNWQGGTNLTYYLQSSPNLGTNVSWNDIYTIPPSLSGTGTITNLSASNTANYYRIRTGSQ